MVECAAYSGKVRPANLQERVSASKTVKLGQMQEFFSPLIAGELANHLTQVPGVFHPAPVCQFWATLKSLQLKPNNTRTLDLHPADSIEY